MRYHLFLEHTQAFNQDIDIHRAGHGHGQIIQLKQKVIDSATKILFIGISFTGPVGRSSGFHDNAMVIN